MEAVQSIKCVQVSACVCVLYSWRAEIQYIPHKRVSLRWGRIQLQNGRSLDGAHAAGGVGGIEGYRSVDCDGQTHRQVCACVCVIHTAAAVMSRSLRVATVIWLPLTVKSQEEFTSV